jgi:hypothetical protein
VNLSSGTTKGCSDAHFGFGDFGDLDIFRNGTSAGSDVRPGLSSLLTGLQHRGQLHRLRLCIA